MQIIDILLIDDDKSYCQEVKNQLRSIGIDEYDYDVIVKDFQNLEEGFNELKKESKYKAVILDARCLLTKEQEKEDFKFLPEALDELEKINQQTGIYTPFVVNTGYYDTEILSSLSLKIERHKGKIFDKSKQAKEMLQHLLNEIENSIDTKIEKQFDDVFKAVKHLPTNPTDFRKKLINVLKDFENPAKNGSVLSEVRIIQEEMYKVLKQKNSAIIPNGSFADKNKHLDGNEQWNQSQQKKLPNTTVYQTPVLSYLASSVFKICSSFGNHSTSKPTNVNVEYWELPSNYAVKSVVFALLEQLLWFKNLMEKP